MSQKIVIKANVKREPQNSVPNVSYEWHWRRIVSVSMLVAMTSAAVVYGLTSSVNAEQGEQPNEQELHVDNSLQDNNARISETQQSDDAANANKHISASEIAHTAPSTDSLQAVDDVPVENALLATNEASTALLEKRDTNTETMSSQQSDSADELISVQPSHRAVSHSLSDPLSEIKSEDGALASSEKFAANAHIASVALGAQIDTSKISRAVLTRKVSKREPTNVFAADIRLNQFEDALSFFSELKNLQGQQVKHVWLYEGEVMAEISLDVTSPRYRTYSTKNIMTTQTGHWRVDVVDEQGNLIAQKEFRILAN